MSFESSSGFIQPAITVTRGDESGEWFKVTYNDKTGYVKDTALKNLSAIKEQPKDTANAVTASIALGASGSKKKNDLGTGYTDTATKNNSAYDSLVGRGDSDGIGSLSSVMSNNASDLGGFANIMNMLSGNDDGTYATASQSDIPDLDKDTIASEFGGEDNLKKVTINKYSILSNSKAQDARLKKILNNTYNVRAQRVEQLLEKIIDMMDDRNDDKPGTSDKSSSTSPTNLFTDDSIPKAIQLLSKG